ncbi:uncharacterized protein LOC117119680 [Anneissia japonica]|uniref:uncharacterized protein LOC117119680 n=1 Tax=Anneissia japonica TaxID=1529436 RepID=UPI00142596D9|nr:uncharacterized protein LOC117119680 [Anneissia japonica]
MTEMKGEHNSPQDVWDRYLPKWNQWLESLNHLKNVNVKRCYRPPDFGVVKGKEIHIFSDASNLAIGAVAYLRQVNEHNQPYVSFLLAKAKVTPTHAVFIPRLELCAAVLATTLVRTICSELGSRIILDSTTFYTDSKVVLGYISNESKRFHTYVANRVNKIHDTLLKPHQGHHVPTDENPANIASRSVPASHLNATIWFKGPTFLWQKNYLSESREKPHPNPQYLLFESDPELRTRQRKFYKLISYSHNEV